MKDQNVNYKSKAQISMQIALQTNPVFYKRQEDPAALCRFQRYLKRMTVFQ